MSLPIHGRNDEPLCAGGGVTQLVMPRMFDAVQKHQHDFIAWRWSYFLPGAMHIFMAVLVIFLAQVCFWELHVSLKPRHKPIKYPKAEQDTWFAMQDLPDGNFRDVKRAGKKKEGRADTLKAVWCAARYAFLLFCASSELKHVFLIILPCWSMISLVFPHSLKTPFFGAETIGPGSSCHRMASPSALSSQPIMCWQPTSTTISA